MKSFWKTRLNGALLASCVALAGSAQAATYYVSTTGSDSNPGTQSAPFRHVSKGASAAHAGDTVIVMDGTYDNEGQVADSGGGGSVVTVTNVGTASAPITIMAQNRGKAILNAAASSQSSLGCSAAWAYFDLSYTAYVIIQGFVIENACINAFHANANAHDITIRWNEIKNIGNWNNPASSLSPTGIYINNSEYNFTFDGNIWHDIGGGTNVNQQHAIYTAASNVTIVNNVFYNQTHGWDIQTSAGRNIYIANNTFAFPNPGRQGHIVLWDGGNNGSLANVIVENNIFYQPLDIAVVSLLGAPINGCTIQYNIVTTGSMWDNGSSCSMGNNMTSTDPMLVNPSGLDFHLQTGSPAIGTGMTLSYTTVDFSNVTRTGNYDRGAFAYNTSTSGSGSGPVTVPVTIPATLSILPSTVSLSLLQGQSVTTQLTATATGGAAPSFSASGLPSGVSASFSPSSCPGSCTTTLTLSASAKASGSSSFKVFATSGSLSASSTVNLSIQVPVTPVPPVSSSGDYATGLVAEWKLLGNATDSVSGATASAHGGVSFAGAPSLFGAETPALLLDGTSGYLAAPESAALEISNQMTVAFWVRALPNKDGARLIAKAWDWDVKLNGVNPQFTANGRYAMTNYSLPLYTWTHIAFTFSGGTVTAYVNGQQVGFAANTFSSGVTLPTGPYGLYLGTDSSVADFFAGGMSDVRIYNRALSSTDVRALFSAKTSAILH